MDEVAAAIGESGSVQVGETQSERPVVLFLTVVSARGLPRTTAGVTSNPYIRIQYGNIKYRTSTVPKSLQPIWNESFIFPLEEKYDLRYSIYDSVSIGRDTVIGIKIK
jgi:phosphatidylserine decarboxylase